MEAIEIHADDRIHIELGGIEKITLEPEYIDAYVDAMDTALKNNGIDQVVSNRCPAARGNVFKHEDGVCKACGDPYDEGYELFHIPPRSNTQQGITQLCESCLDGVGDELYTFFEQNPDVLLGPAL